MLNLLRCLLLLLVLPACTKESPSPAAPAGQSAVPSSMRLDSAPPAAVSVVDARSAADGAEVVVAGRVRDFVEARAVFTIADMSLKSCLDPEDPSEGCPTPWDYCCVDRKALKEGTATIEVLDGDKPALGSAKGWNGLDHLKEVVVRGKLRKDGDGNLSVLATGVYVKP